MALDKAQKAIFRGKYGDKFYDLLVQAENVMIDENTSLADKLSELVSSINGKATSADITTAIDAALGSVPEGATATTVYGYITEAINGLNIGNYATTDALKGVTDKVNVLIGSDANKSMRTIADEVVAGTDHLHRKKVTAVSDIDPTAEGADQYVYMVPKGTGKSSDKYDEYMIIDGSVEKVGDWEVDLNNYVQKEAGKSLSANDYSDDEKQKVAASKEVTDKLTNADVLKNITAANVGDWNGKSTVYFGSTEPADAKNGDIWLQPLR